MEKRLGSILSQLGSAIEDFDRSLAIDKAMLDPIVADAVQSGQAQKFEFTVELFWKSVKVFLLEQHGVDAASPKSVIKKYFELGFVDYDACEKLLRALDIRNLLSHTYKKEGFALLYKDIVRYKGLFRKAIEPLFRIEGSGS